MAETVGKINAMELSDIITIPETQEEINAVIWSFGNYTREEAAEQIFKGINIIIKKINDINLEINRNLTRDAEDLRADTMSAIIWALDTLGTQPINHWMKEFFPFLSTSDKAEDFLAYIWNFFYNAREIIKRIYDTRSIKVTEYKKTGADARHKWQRFSDTRKATDEIITTVNDFANKIYETRKEAEEKAEELR